MLPLECTISDFGKTHPNAELLHYRADHKIFHGLVDI